MAAIGAKTADLAKSAGGGSRQERRVDTDRRRPPHLRRDAGQRPGARAAVRRPGHARDARKPGARHANRLRRGRATARSRSRSIVLDGHRHIRRPPSCSPPRCPATSARSWLASDTIGRAGAAAADQAARWHRPLAHDDALPHARRQPHSTKKVSNPPSPVDEPEVDFGQTPPPGRSHSRKGPRARDREESRVVILKRSSNAWYLQ